MHRQGQRDFDGAARVQATAADAPDNETMSSALSAFHPAVRRGSRAPFPARPRRRLRPGRRSRRAATRWSPRRPARARRSPRSWRRSTRWCAKAWRTGLPDETQVVYVSPLKALSNDIHLNLEAPLAGIRAELARHGPARRRHPHRGAHRRHAAVRARAHAQVAAAHPGDHAGIAVRAARFGIRAARCWRRCARSSSTKSTRWPRASAAATCRCRWSGWKRCAGGG